MRDMDDLGFWIFMSVFIACVLIAPNLQDDCAHHHKNPELIKDK